MAHNQRQTCFVVFIHLLFTDLHIYHIMSSAKIYKFTQKAMIKVTNYKTDLF